MIELASREQYTSGSGKVEFYKKDKTRDHDEIVLRLKDGRRVVISNNTKLGIRVEPKEGDEVNYHGYGVKGTNVVHKVHPNKSSRGGWLEHVKKGEATRKFSYEGLMKMAGPALQDKVSAGVPGSAENLQVYDEPKYPDAFGHDEPFAYHSIGGKSGYLPLPDETYTNPPPAVAKDLNLMYEDLLPYLSTNGGFSRTFSRPIQPQVPESYASKFYRGIPVYFTPYHTNTWWDAATSGLPIRKSGTTRIVFNGPGQVDDSALWTHEIGHGLLQDDMSDEEKALLKTVFPNEKKPGEAASTILEDQLRIANAMRGSLGRDPKGPEYVSYIRGMGLDELAKEYAAVTNSTGKSNYKLDYTFNENRYDDDIQRSLISHLGNPPKYSPLDYDVFGAPTFSELDNVRRVLRDKGIYARNGGDIEPILKKYFDDFYYGPSATIQSAPAFAQKPGLKERAIDMFSPGTSRMGKYKSYEYKKNYQMRHADLVNDINRELLKSYYDELYKYNADKSSLERNPSWSYTYGSPLYYHLYKNPDVAEAYRRLLLGGMKP